MWSRPTGRGSVGWADELTLNRAQVGDCVDEDRPGRSDVLEDTDSWTARRGGQYRPLVRSLAVSALCCLVLSGCEWTSGESADVRIGFVRDAPLVFPMTVDPSDLSVPSEIADSLVEFWNWDGEPFSWQCYGLIGLSGAEPTVKPVPERVDNLSVPMTVTAGDLLRISAEWSGEPDVTELCTNDAGFVPPVDTGGIARAPLSNCEVGILVNGEHARANGEAGAYAGDLRLIAGPFDAAGVTIELASIDCVGRQYNSGNVTLTVERFASQFSGNLPWTGTTVPTPTTSFPTGATTTTTLPTTSAPECPPDPGNGMLRGETAYALWLAAGQPTGSPPHEFVDIPPGAFYEDAINYVVDAGITTGTGSSTYSPNDPTVRANFAAFVYRFAGSPSPSTSHGFGDVPSYANDAVSWVVENGLMTGLSSSQFGSNAMMKHADAETAIVALNGAVDYYGCTSS